MARWRVALALATVYVAWGATYPAIAVLVRTTPPFLGMGARFLAAGLILAVALRLLRRPRPPLAAREALGSALIGPWILGPIGLLAVAEKHVESGLAALIIGSVPLWVLLLEAAFRIRRPRPGGLIACLVGFGGLALVVGPGGDAALVWAALLFATAAYEASGEVASSHVPQIPDALRATVWQLYSGGLALTLVGLLAGEAGDVRWAAMEMETLWAFAFLVVVGSVAAYPALVWLLAETPTSTATTYAYVNPVVALVLGAVLLDERFSTQALVGAAIILASVFVVVRSDAAQAAAQRG